MKKITKRRMQKKFFEHKIKLLIFVIISLFFILATGYAYFFTNIEIGGEATIIDDISDDLVCEYNLLALFEKVNSWVDGDKNTTKTNLTITNNGDTDIIGWEIKVAGPSDLEITFSNAEYLMGDGYYILTPSSWMETIPAGGYISFEITFATVEDDFQLKYIYLDDCKLLGTGHFEINPNSDKLRKIILAPLSETLYVNQSIALIATKIPSIAPGDIEFVSNNPSVASVDSNGYVTALKKGIAVITARIGRISATSTIYVIDDVVTEDKIFNFTFTTGYINKDTNQMQFRIDIENLTNVSYSKISFDIGLPEGTTYDLWNNPGFVINENNFYLDMQWGNMIEPGGFIYINGIITIPEGENVNSYIHPAISNLIIIE